MHLKALAVLMYCDSSAPWRKNSTKSFGKNDEADLFGCSKNTKAKIKGKLTIIRLFTP